MNEKRVICTKRRRMEMKQTMICTVSQHAKERYSERIMDKNHPTDVTMYINNNLEKINTDINKMIEYGQLIHSGKNENGQVMDIYLKDLWIILVDKNKSKVITLFKIDLGVGEDFDKEFINRNLDKLLKAKENYSQVTQEIERESNDYDTLVKENERIINEYKSIIKKLENQNAAYKDVIASLKVNKDIALKEINDIVAVLIGKKSF